MNNIHYYSLMFFCCFYVSGAARNPFQPPDISLQCRLPDRGEPQWRLQGTVLQQDKQAARLSHPSQGYYLLFAGQYLPGTLWQVEQITRGRVILRNTGECQTPLWLLTMATGHARER